MTAAAAAAAEPAVASGGPLDGSRLADGSSALCFTVVTADGAAHLYRRSQQTATVEGARVRVYEWGGRTARE